MFLKRAMRYYRVWIYSCNLALFVSTLVFIILSLWIASDFHLSLFPNITFYQPSFIYAYMALTLQSGILQAIGCMGANRMNERLLGLYWQILLILLIGDIVVGIIWLFRYNLLLTNLRSDLIYRLDNDYGFDTDFQELWDRVQSEHQCCGIDTPYDYNMTQWFEREHATYEGAQFLVPQSCCAYHRFPMIQTIHSTNQGVVDDGSGGDGGVTGGNVVTGETAGSKDGLNQRSTVKNKYGRDDGGADDGGGGVGGDGGGSSSLIATRTTSADCMDSYRPENIYTSGCYNQILEWLQSSVDCLSVIGFCVITFLKLCFAFILRYEIKEMIQKINLIKGDKERNDSTTLQHLEAYLPRPSIQNDSNQALLSNQSPHSQQSNNNAINNNNNNNVTNFHIDNTNSNNNNNNLSSNNNKDNSFVNNSTNVTNKRNRISTTNQSSFNSSIGSYGTSCVDSTTINIPTRYSPQTIPIPTSTKPAPATPPTITATTTMTTGNLGNTVKFSSSPPIKRLAVTSSSSTSTTNSVSKSNKQSTTATPTPTLTTSPATLITTVTSSSGAETTILPSSSSSTSTPVNSNSLIGMISLPSMGDKSNNSNKSKSFNSNNNNQVLVTNF